ncbi:hypothetical protein J6590_014631 [Homalodisca vitripennis]|nr:hypothetical protein J6590_014631 [Homalodisca vitripennis]
MGFSTNLQSRGGHEALLGRQDAELRLLETMRRCLITKLRCDRDYSSALCAVTAQGQKVERGDENNYLTGSLVAQAWKGVLEELENVAKLLKINADIVEKETLEKLNTLYIEKKKARKTYQDEHTRISLQMSNPHWVCSLLARIVNPFVNLLLPRIYIKTYKPYLLTFWPA